MTGPAPHGTADAADEDLTLIDQWIEEVYALNLLPEGPRPRPTSTPTAKQMLKRDGAGAVALVRAYVVKLQEHAKRRVSHEFMHSLAKRLLKRELPFSEDDLIWLAERAAVTRDFWEWPLDGIVTAIERHAARHGMSDALRAAAEKMQRNVEKVAWHKSTRDAIPRLNVLTRGTDLVFSVDTGELWAQQLLDDIEKLDGAQRKNWNRVLAHAQKSTASKPSASWLSEARRLVRLVGVDEFCSRIGDWFPLFSKGRTDEAPADLTPKERDYWPNETSVPYELLLKGLVWCCQAVPDARNRPVLEALMAECCRETPFGKRFAEGGTACRRALEAME